MLTRWLSHPFRVLLTLGLVGALLVALLVALAAAFVAPTLPTLESLTDYRPKIPLRVYSAEGLLIGEFGEERRAVVKINEVPLHLKQAILAAEDERFYQHGGVDYIGVLRAIYSNFSLGGVRQGASTITMQVARNFFLSKEKTLMRKFSEALLAFKIEQSLSKDEILELYINQIYLGQRAYGFAAAAQIYFGKPLDQINIAEAAMLAGLPKAPSRYNPVVNPRRAKLRQTYVLRRMRETGAISEQQYSETSIQVLQVGRQSQAAQAAGLAGAAHADYVAEMARAEMVARYQEAAYTQGYKVYTTVRWADQQAAYQALRKGVLDYDKRHGYRGPEAYLELPKNSTVSQEELLEDALLDIESSDDLHPAVVVATDSKTVNVYFNKGGKGGETIEIGGDGLKFVQKMLTDKVGPKQRIKPGALVRIQKTDKGLWQIVQLPQVEASLVSMEPQSGAIRALVGGFDFARNQYNHVMQASRQPGSSFKPFIYSASLEKGFTPATVINDAPLSFTTEQTGSEAWEPRNYDGTYEGPMRMRTALAKSKNLVSIRILQAIGPQYAQDYVTRFGFDAKQHPPYLTMALGAGAATPMQMANGYAVFANGGFRVTPYLIARIEDEHGKILEAARPSIAGEGAEQVIDQRNAFLMNSLMMEVVRHGTASKALSLGRSDLAGKTGTTSDFIDAWFCGFQRNLVAIAWIGFDRPKSLGNGETGGNAALPMWIDYMGKALKDVPMATYTPPEGVAAIRIDPASGARTSEGGMVEYFLQEYPPPEAAAETVKPAEEVKDQLL